MAITHSTPADASMSEAGKAAWNADHTGTWPASDVTFTQSGSGASSRTVSAKLQEHPSIEDYSSAGGVADQIQKAIDANVGKIVIARSSSYAVDAPVDFDDDSWLIGQGISGTTFTKSFNGASDSQGIFNIKSGASGTIIEGATLRGGTGTTGGCLISNVAVLGAAADACVLRDLWLTTQGSDTQTYTLYWDGSARSGAPLGIRDNTFVNVHVFGAATAAARIHSVIRLNWIGGGIAAAGGTSGKLILSGTAGVVTTNCSINVGVISNGVDALDLDRVTNSTIIVGNLGNVANTNTVTDVKIMAGAVGTVETDWLRSWVELPGTVYFGTGAPSFNARQGALYLRSDGSSTSTRAYINSDGGTTWVAVTTAS